MQRPPTPPRRQPPAGSGRPQPPRGGRQQPTRRRKKNNAVVSLGILAALIVVLLLVALFVPGMLGGDISSSLPVSSASVSVSVAPVSSAPPVSAVSVYTPPAVGDYIEEGIPLLVRADRPLPADYEETLVLGSIGSYQMEESAATAFLAMQAAALADGISLYPVSGYRSNAKQTTNYNNALQNYLAQGYSQDEAERLTQRYYAIPGSSEHEAGLAVDVNSLETTFENTREFAWLQENCATYGFVMRYHKDKTEETGGIAYEPWHYRYVGTNHAKAMQDLDMTLDAYVPMLEEQELQTGMG